MVCIRSQHDSFCNYLTRLSLNPCDLWISAGRIDATEIQVCLRNIGVNISLEDANRILLRYVINQ